jgi:hypothetical protein
MTDEAHSRRDALRRAGLAAGAFAAAGMLRPAFAAAQSTSNDDLRDYLVPAVGLEQITVLAYATALDKVDPDVRDQLTTLRDQEQAHASAWREALDSLGFDSPDAPDSPEDTGVFDGVDGLDDATASDYQDLLGKIGDANSPQQLYDLIADLEKRQIAYYVEKAPAVDSFDLATTSAEISGSQAAHVIIIGALRGQAPADAAAAVNAAVKAGVSAAANESSSGSSTTSTTTTGSSTTSTTSTTSTGG